ncbi:MAG TPA: proline dehydrogenase family protein [Ktedonobacterales bacterium]|nr:proline dehydrogenase family protein [Ktedonobacterales bacterium]
MLKESMLYLARQEGIRTFVIANPTTRRVARRFVAGEELSDALAVARTLNQRHISASLDLLGENVSVASEARATADNYMRTLDAIQAMGVEANISVKLTALGLDLGDDLCRANLTRVLQRAQEYGSFVRVDMEGSDYTRRTLNLVVDLHQQFDNVGTVIQSCMYRSPDDVALLIEHGVRVRLVKGAYLEPPTLAFPHKVDVDAQYVLLMRALLERGVYPAIATHDEHIIQEAIRIAKAQGIARARFEFQMLYGIRRDLQTRLADAGYNVRVYVPYGSQWYPYLTRRMAERPANLMFVVGNAFRG